MKKSIIALSLVSLFAAPVFASDVIEDGEGGICDGVICGGDKGGSVDSGYDEMQPITKDEAQDSRIGDNEKAIDKIKDIGKKVSKNLGGHVKDNQDKIAKNEGAIADNAEGINKNADGIKSNAKAIDAVSEDLADFKFTAQQAYNQLDDKIDRVEDKVSVGVAMVGAMANVPVVTGQSTVGMGVANFNGTNALAVGYSTSFDNGVSLKLSGAYGDGEFDSDFMVGAGVGYSW